MAEKQRRIRGQDYWELYDGVEALEEARREFEDWRKKKARELGDYVDRLNFVTGAIVENAGTPEAKVAGRLEQKVLDEAETHVKKIREAEEKVRLKRKGLAAKYRTWPDCIVPATGEIKDEGIETAEPPPPDGENEAG